MYQLGQPQFWLLKLYLLCSNNLPEMFENKTTQTFCYISKIGRLYWQEFGLNLFEPVKRGPTVVEIFIQFLCLLEIYLLDCRAWIALLGHRHIWNVFSKQKVLSQTYESQLIWLGTSNSWPVKKGKDEFSQSHFIESWPTIVRKVIIA